MGKTEISAKAKEMQSVEDLANLLTDIMRDEFGSIKYPITAKQLFHFCNPNIAGKRYKVFHIRKKSGGEREINAPVPQLATILCMLNILLKAIYIPNDYAMGFLEGRSIVSNAERHVGHNYVLNIDLKDFFPSIPQARVWKKMQCPPFSFPQKIANVIAGLCCNLDEASGKNVLPQGAPTSPLLTNTICERLDYKMAGVAKRFGLHYSRYADDMTFSSMHNVYQENGDFMQEIRRIVESEGFKMNEAKTRLLKEGRRQEVTGLTVNNTVNVTRKYICDLRFILNVWEKYGYEKAYACFYPRYKHEKGYIKKGEPVMENVIGGKLNYLGMVKGKNNPLYQRLQSRYDKLQQIVYMDSETDMGKNYIYVQPYKLADFEELFKTSISLQVTARHKLVGKCELYGMSKSIAISRSAQKAFCPDLEKREEGEVVVSEILKDAYVTLCRQKGKNFWLITNFAPQRSKCLSVQNAKIDIDRLLDVWEKEGIEKAVEMFTMSLDGMGEEYVDNSKSEDVSDKNEQVLKRNAKKKSRGNKQHSSRFGDIPNYDCLMTNTELLLKMLDTSNCLED